jgi:hypothetical protein
MPVVTSQDFLPFYEELGNLPVKCPFLLIFTSPAFFLFSPPHHPYYYSIAGCNLIL